MPDGVDWHPAYVRAAGLRLRVGRHGSGPPLLLITGIGAHLDMWSPFARFAGDRELIAFDPPGAGLSQRPRRPLRMGGLADVVAQLLDVMRLDRGDGLGYSFGGALAQELARRAPDRVRRLVLCAARPGLGGSPPRPLPPPLLAPPPPPPALLPPPPGRCSPRPFRWLTSPCFGGARRGPEPAVLARHARERLQQ